MFSRYFEIMERFENIIFPAEAFHGGSIHSSSWSTFDEISRPRSSLWILGSDFVNVLEIPWISDTLHHEPFQKIMWFYVIFLIILFVFYILHITSRASKFFVQILQRGSWCHRFCCDVPRHCPLCGRFAVAAEHTLCSAHFGRSCGHVATCGCQGKQ